MIEGGGLMATPSEPPLQPVFKEPRPVNPNSLPFFSRIVEDIIVNIFGRLEEDPRNLARLACVCRRFHSVIKTSCYKRQCMRVVPTVVSELMQASSRQDVLVEPPGGWSALQKLLVCCPGLCHTGVLLNCWDYGLERAIGRSEDFELMRRNDLPNLGAEAQEDQEIGTAHTSDVIEKQEKNLQENVKNPGGPSDDTTVSGNVRQTCYREISEETNMPGTVLEPKGEQTSEQRGVDTASEVEARKSTSGKRKKKELMGNEGPIKQMQKGDLHYHGKVMKEPKFHGSYRPLQREGEHARNRERRGSKEASGSASGGRSNETERCMNHEEEPHLAKGTWILTREQGNKLLASRFRSDSLYICDWPGCMHQGEKRVYKLFRGVFKNFEQSHVFRNLKDLRAKTTDIRCAFCSEETYDMLTNFCLRRSFEYHDDGEPVIRAYVCESGHVAGAWTDRPLYNL